VVLGLRRISAVQERGAGGVVGSYTHADQDRGTDCRRHRKRQDQDCSGCAGDGWAGVLGMG
jgi:hypothetical protein